MTNPPSSDEARSALHSVELGQRQVLNEINIPWWYWWGLALGWVVLGAIAESSNPWALGVATFVFGAIHSAVAQRVVSGRLGSRHVSVRAEVVGTRLQIVVIGSLFILAALTVGVALILSADHAGAPAFLAGIFVAVIVLLGGPNVTNDARRRATKNVLS